MLGLVLRGRECIAQLDYLQCIRHSELRMSMFSSFSSLYQSKCLYNYYNTQSIILVANIETHSLIHMEMYPIGNNFVKLYAFNW